MAWRVTQSEVRDLIDSDSDIDMGPFIQTANVLVDKVTARDSGSLMSASDLLELERYLAAHFYEHRDPQVSREKTGEASATFQGEFGKGLESSKWGRTALMLDETGLLKSLDKGGRTRMLWLGRSPSEQTDYVDRD